MSFVGTFQSAALEMASAQPLKVRLASAYVKHLELLEADALPDLLRSDLLALRAAFSAHKPLNGETAAQATLRKLGPAELEALAQRVIALYGDAVRLASPLRLVGNTEPEADPESELEPNVVIRVVSFDDIPSGLRVRA